jgi:hypothetical protein
VDITKGLLAPGLLSGDPKVGWEDPFNLGINDNPPIVSKDRLRNVFRFMFI